MIFSALGTFLDVFGGRFDAWRDTLRHRGVSKSSLGDSRCHFGSPGVHLEGHWGAIGRYYGPAEVPFGALGSPKASIWRSFRRLQEPMKMLVFLYKIIDFRGLGPIWRHLGARGGEGLRQHGLRVVNWTCLRPTIPLSNIA